MELSFLMHNGNADQKSQYNNPTLTMFKVKKDNTNYCEGCTETWISYTFQWESLVQLV